MDMKLLLYHVAFDEKSRPTVEKKKMGKKKNEIVFKPEETPDTSSRTNKGLELESAYRILEDYKNIQTSEKYLEEFVEKFFEKDSRKSNNDITPGQIEEWLDVEMDANPQDITGRKWNS